jgi:hypothetical protein
MYVTSSARGFRPQFFEIIAQSPLFNYLFVIVTNPRFPMQIKMLICLPAAVCSIPSLANTIYIGHSQSQQITAISERELHLTPSGISALVAVEPGEHWSLAFDYSTQEDQQSVTNLVRSRFSSDSWGVSLGYYWQDWSISLAYANWQDTLVLNHDRDSRFQFERKTDSPTYNLSLSHYWHAKNWYSSVTLGLSTNDWQQYTRFINSLGPQSVLEKGDSTFTSLRVSGARTLLTFTQGNLSVGGSVSWNQHLDSESATVARNGRHISQISNLRLRTQLSQQHASGSESYGQYNVYLSLELGGQWLLDMDSSWDYATDNNTHAWSVNLGYLF